MRHCLYFVIVSYALSGCGFLSATSPFHVNPITKPYNSTDSDSFYEFNLTRDPFDLDKDCLPGLGGTLKDDVLICRTSAVEAIINLAQISNTLPAAGSVATTGLGGQSQQLLDIQLAQYPPTSQAAPAGDATGDPVFQSRLGRNRLQEHLISQSNDVCDINKAAMFGKITVANLLFDLATIGLASASTIVTGGASTILSGAATATAGGRASINENLVQNLLVTAITESIDNTRANSLTSIRSRQSSNLDSYSIEAAVGDVLLYHEECSLYAGLETLRQQASDIRTSREEQITRIRQLLDLSKELKEEGASEAEASVMQQLERETAVLPNLESSN